MTEGELLQLTLLGRTELTEDQYLDVLRRKTAFLFSACCEVGAMLGGAGDEQRIALRDYGMNLGTAFQLIDDLLDFTGTGEALGKAAGADLLEGKLTLPLIYLMQSDDSARELVQKVIGDGNYSSIPRSQLIAAVEETGAVRRAKARADEYAEAARDCLNILPDSDYCDSLRAIPTYVLERES
jgi:octaprenyl-diphosphate synthase